MTVFYLVLSVIFNTGFALCYKIAVRHKCDLNVVNSLMYVGATLFLLAFVLHDGRIAYHPTALLLGVIAGVSVFFATLTFFYHMRQGTLSVSWAVIGLSIGFPVLASIFLWGEMPTTRQTVGLLLLPIALLLFSVQNGVKK